MAYQPYDLDLINALRNASVAERVDYFEAMFDKNKNFFKTESISVYQLLIEHGQTNFEIEMTERFFNIKDQATHESIHPEDQLDLYAEKLGSWLGEQWQDLINFRVAVFNKTDSLHTRFCLSIEYALHHKFPAFSSIMPQKIINLKTIVEGKICYVPCVVFIGVSHGLHIAHFLNHTVKNNIFLHEPDISKFILSCYFLDYEQIKKNSNIFMIAIGENQLSQSIRMFMSQQSFPQRVWLRVCSDPENISSQKTHDILSTLKAAQMRSDHVFFPIDLYLERRKNAVKQLENQLPLLTKKIQLSHASQVVIVGSGPSLGENIEWLKQNKSNLIIFAVLSSVRALTAHDIVPDFVFTIDTTSEDHLVEEVFKIPRQSTMVGMHGISQSYTTLTERTLLCGVLQDNAFIRYQESINFYGPSTINFIVAFALLIQVKHIFLIGCDCGYAQVGNLYSPGTSHHALFGEDVDKTAATKGQFQVPKNTNIKEMIYSTTELMNVLSGITSVIQEFNQGSVVYNLAENGAFIQATQPKVASKIQLGRYRQKQEDLQAIHNAFSPATKGKNWFLYENRAQELFNEFKTNILNELKQMPQSWDELTDKLGSVAYRHYLPLKQEEGDGRLGPYLFLFEYPLRIIFNYIIRLDYFNEAQEVYKVAIDLFEQQMDQLEWQSELSEF